MNQKTVDALQKTRAKKAENRTKGIRPPNPIERAKQNPKSMRFAINAQCYDCIGRDTGWRNMVKTCTAPDCPLYGFRPYK